MKFLKQILIFTLIYNTRSFNYNIESKKCLEMNAYIYNIVSNAQKKDDFASFIPEVEFSIRNYHYDISLFKNNNEKNKHQDNISFFILLKWFHIEDFVLNTSTKKALKLKSSLPTSCIYGK